MKLTHYIYLSTALAALAACSDDIDRVYTVGEADNAIVLRAGVREGGSGVQTRAEGEPTYYSFVDGTKMALRIQGKWTGKDLTNDLVTKPTTGTINTEAESDKDLDGEADGNTEKDTRGVGLSPMLYWDDYGTADPANATNRANGLTVLGVAVDGETSTAPTIADDKWEGGFAWSVNTNGADVLKKDLLVSNNFKYGTATGYIFDTRTTNNLLKFEHVLSKITINLTANLGFPTTEGVGNTTNHFQEDPVFTLTNNKVGETATEYPLTSGEINISTGEVSTTSTSGSAVIAETISYPSGSGNKVTVRKEALVFPDTQFGTSDESVIGKVVADGNVYYITAKEIRDAIRSKEGETTDYKAKKGYNYILNIIVNKTSVILSATIGKWTEVIAQEDYPEIDVTASYGDPVSGDLSNAFNNRFSLYVSENKEYAADPLSYYGIAPTSPNTSYLENRWYNNSDKKLYVNADTDAPFYWPNHEIGYYFRGVYPRTNVNTSSPTVEVFDKEETTNQGIPVSNVKYEQNTHPSDLMVGIPMKKQADGSMDFDEGTSGITATKGTVTLHFTYRMAQVEVLLKSSGADNENNIDFGSKTGTGPEEVTITQAKVEIINGYTDGYILLSDGSAVGKNVGSYTMTAKSTTLPSAVPTLTQYNVDIPTFRTNIPSNVRHDAVIPQGLTGPDNKPLQFKITTYSADGTKDEYFIDIKDITLTSINGVNCDSSNNHISEWEAGKHYVYTLNITKTQVTIEATIADWTTVYASGDFWLGMYQQK